MHQATRIFLVEDQDLIIDSLRNRFKEEADFEYVGCAHSQQEALDRINEKIDVLMLDIISDRTGMRELVQSISQRFSHIKIVVLTGREGAPYALATKDWGARGYISKTISLDGICNAIRRIAKGQMVFEFSDDSDCAGVREVLSRRELQILSLFCKGFGNQEIAQFLKIKVATVDVHKKNLKKKLADFGVTNDASMGHFAAECRLCEDVDFSTPQQEVNS